MAIESEGASAATLPPAPEPRTQFLVSVDPETAKALYELGGIRREFPGVVARHVLQAHARAELQKGRDSLLSGAAE
jgi:hypothetical protein